MRAFVSSWAERLPLRINSLSRARSSALNRTTYFFTAISFQTTNHLHRCLAATEIQTMPSFSMTGATRGFPVIRITADYKDNEKRLGAFIQDRMAQWYMEAGVIAVEKGPVGTQLPSTHAYGGTRMGDNRETNVVNRWGFSHEVPNLGILGASVMGTSGAHNPTLTAQALARRTAEHLAANWRTIADR
jgi:choline dehydrogenase-like flavoprotein